LSALPDLLCAVLYLHDRIGHDDLQKILFKKGISQSGEVRADSRVLGELHYKISNNGQRNGQNAEKAHRLCIFDCQFDQQKNRYVFQLSNDHIFDIVSLCIGKSPKQSQ
jgi:hypothetical protein